MLVDGGRVKFRHADTTQVSRGTRQREKQVLYMSGTAQFSFAMATISTE